MSSSSSTSSSFSSSSSSSMLQKFQRQFFLIISIFILFAIIFSDAAPANDVPMRLCSRKLINTLTTVCQETVCAKLETHNEAKNPMECCVYGCTYSNLQDICCS
uniref:Uncharacterized protein n=1 Tax=Panagrolaimus sp. PS1159 TaxID=55785 RepID=A0AC35G5C4_9BILA